MKEMKQLHERVSAHPIRLGDLTEEERMKVLDCVEVMVQKKDGKVKSR